jgi:hypothetical protein
MTVFFCAARAAALLLLPSSFSNPAHVDRQAALAGHAAG